MSSLDPQIDSSPDHSSVRSHRTIDRRAFLATSAGAAILAASGLSQNPTAINPSANDRMRLNRHRFGVNYTPSHNWWFCWNDWLRDPIQRDLDRVASLGADHLRVLLIWPYFQPNLTWISPAHLDHLDGLMTIAAARNLDVLVTVFTGQLSGWFFLPPFNKPDPAFYTDERIAAAQNLFVRELSQRMQAHSNFLGFDLGNELNTCWTADLAAGDAWMTRMLAQMHQLAPGGIHVNGVDNMPWFQPTTFSARTLAAQRFPVMHCYPWWTHALRYGGPMDPPSTGLLKAMAALIRSYSGNSKTPVWAGEFNTCIESLNEKQQAQWLETAVTGAIQEGVSWFTYWDSHDVSRAFAFNSVEYTLGLLSNDGQVKEQGRTFKRLADTYRGKTVILPTSAPLPPPNPQTFENTWKWLLNELHWKPKTS
jgi:endo-1,4-beta-mannosidase